MMFVHLHLTPDEGLALIALITSIVNHFMMRDCSTKMAAQVKVEAETAAKKILTDAIAVADKLKALDARGGLDVK